MQDRPIPDSKQTKKPALLSSSSQLTPVEYQPYTSFIALSDSLLSPHHEKETYNLETHHLSSVAEWKHFTNDAEKIGLPDNKFAIFEKGQLEIYCSKSMKVLQPIKLPFDEGKEFETSKLSLEKWFVTSDQKMLVIQTKIDITRNVYLLNKTDFVYSKQPYYVDVFIDLQSYQIFHRKQDELQQITWLGDGQYISFIPNYKKNGLFQIRSLYSDKVLPCEVSEGGYIDMLYTFPQHPSLWLASVKESKYGLYLYEVKKSADKVIATRRKKIEVDNPFISVPVCMVSPHSFVFNDFNLKGNHNFWEFDLKTMEPQKIEIPGFTKLSLRCQLPDGRLLFWAQNADRKQVFLTVKLRSVREYADQVERELVNAIDSVFISAERSQGLPLPVQRMIAGYACGFFAASESTELAATVSERHDIQQLTRG